MPLSTCLPTFNLSHNNSIMYFLLLALFSPGLFAVYGGILDVLLVSLHKAKFMSRGITKHLPLLLTRSQNNTTVNQLLSIIIQHICIFKSVNSCHQEFVSLIISVNLKSSLHSRIKKNCYLDYNFLPPIIRPDCFFFLQEFRFIRTSALVEFG